MENQYIIKGGTPLNGEVTIGGAKNAALGILAAAIMADETVVIDNLPNVRDINVLLTAIESIGATVKRIGPHVVSINGSTINDMTIDYDSIRKIRASYYLLGALLGKYKKAQVALPGGCEIGSRPIEQDESLEEKEKEAVKANVMKLLKEYYEMEEEDFLSAELEIVPAGKARDCGLDRSMVLAYGQDDRVCAFTSLFAMLDVEAVEHTACCILVDKEEIGSVGATGMHSRFFENTVAELVALTEGESELKVRRTLMNSRMLSSDVSAAYDPMYAEVFEKRSAAFFGKGLVFNKFTGSRGKSGSNDANAEYLAKIRNAMDAQAVAYQFAELGKVDAGGGGTIAYIMANYGMEVIDSGVAVLSMHAPWEVTSKADVYEAYKGYRAFIEEM